MVLLLINGFHFNTISITNSDNTCHWPLKLVVDRLHRNDFETNSFRSYCWNISIMINLTYLKSFRILSKGDFAIDDMQIFKGSCSERRMFAQCREPMQNPMSGGRATGCFWLSNICLTYFLGYWNCTDANLLGSDCDLVCMIGHMTTPNMGSKNSCRGKVTYW